MDKSEIRAQIDSIDGQILDLLARRISCAKEIGAMKSKNGEEVYVPSREKLVFKNLLEKTDELVKSQFMEMFGDVTKTAKFPTIELDSLFFQAAILYGVLTGSNKGAFEDCSGLTSVTIGDSVMSIGDSDFI